MNAKYQYSLGLLFAVVTAVGVVLGLGIPAFHAAAKVQWSDSSVGYAVGFGLMLCGIIGAVIYLRR